MTYSQLCRVTNNNNIIEKNICEYIGSLQGGSDLHFNIARIILNAMDAKYKNFHDVVDMITTIAHQNSDSFGGVATYSFYLFTMDYCNDMLKQRPNNDTYELIKSVDNEISIGKRSLDMYLSKQITKRPYVEQLFSTKRKMNISDQFHDTLHDFISVIQSQVVEMIIKVYSSRTCN